MLKKEIVNLSPFEPSQKMRQCGVFRLPLTLRDNLKDLLDFSPPARVPQSISFRAKSIADIAMQTKATRALVQAPSFMISRLEDELEENDIIPYYAFGATTTYIKEDKDRGTPERGVKWDMKAMFVSQSKKHLLPEGDNGIVPVQ